MLSRTSIRLTGILVVLFGLVAAAGAFLLPEQNAGAVTETIAGDIKVTTGPTTGLADGSSIDIEVEALNGVSLNQVSARQCVSVVDNNFSFSGVGGYCAQLSISPANVNAPNGENEFISGPFSPGTTKTNFTYKVGVGTQEVTDFLTGEVRTVNCGPKQANCFLVLWIQQSKNPETFFGTPLVFGAGTGDTTTTTSPGATTTTTLPTQATTTTSGGETTTTTAGVTTTSTEGTTSTSTAATSSTRAPSGTSIGSLGTMSPNGSVPPIDSAVSAAGEGSGAAGADTESTGSLPLTGAQVTGLLGIAALLLAAGATVLALRRRVDV